MSIQLSTETVSASIQIRRNDLPVAASPCRLAMAARGLWPRKTAENLAAVLGKSPRTASYYLAGRYEPDASDAVAIMSYIFRPR